MKNLRKQSKLKLLCNVQKKKILFVLLCSILLVACGEKTIEPPDNISDKVSIVTENSESVSLNDDTDAISETNTQDVAHATTFEATSVDIARIIYGKDVEYFSQSVNNYNVDVFPNEDYLLFCVTLEGEEFPSLIYVYDQFRGGTSTSADELIQPFINSISDNLDIQSDAYNVGDSLRQIVRCAWIKNSGVEKFPLTIQFIPETDYFLSTDIEEYNLACSEGRYDDIWADVQTYINNVSPPSYDNAYTLQSILAPIIECWENIEVQYDSVEKYATFFYSGIDSIDSSTHFVPYATTNDRDIRALIGFYEPNWLFFDNITISSNENIRISVSTKKVEEVVGNGHIYEAYATSLDNDMIDELLSSQNHTIRFTARNDTYKDYEMSADEYEALAIIANFQNVRNILADLCFHFQERQP